MFLILAVVLVVLWLGGFLIFHVSSMLIHLLILFAIISVIMHFVTGRQARSELGTSDAPIKRKGRAHWARPFRASAATVTVYW